MYSRHIKLVMQQHKHVNNVIAWRLWNCNQPQIPRFSPRMQRCRLQRYWGLNIAPPFPSPTFLPLEVGLLSGSVVKPEPKSNLVHFSRKSDIWWQQILILLWHNWSKMGWQCHICI